MPNLWKFFSKSSSDAPKIEEYRFIAAQDLNFGSDETESAAEETEEVLEQEESVQEEPAEEIANPVNYAQIQSEMIL